MINAFEDEPQVEIMDSAPTQDDGQNNVFTFSDAVSRIVVEIKSRGFFDAFRKDCLSDVDTRPAYLNLQQRVESTVSMFLYQQLWFPGLNCNQLREYLRQHLNDSRFLEIGVDRIVDQVVDRNVHSIYLPKVYELAAEILDMNAAKTDTRHIGDTAVPSYTKYYTIQDTHTAVNAGNSFGAWSNQFRANLHYSAQNHTAMSALTGCNNEASSMSISTDSDHVSDKLADSVDPQSDRLVPASDQPDISLPAPPSYSASPDDQFVSAPLPLNSPPKPERLPSPPVWDGFMLKSGLDPAIERMIKLELSSTDPHTQDSVSHAITAVTIAGESASFHSSDSSSRYTLQSRTLSRSSRSHSPRHYSPHSAASYTSSLSYSSASRHHSPERLSPQSVGTSNSSSTWSGHSVEAGGGRRGYSRRPASLSLHGAKGSQERRTRVLSRSPSRRHRSTSHERSSYSSRLTSSPHGSDDVSECSEITASPLPPPCNYPATVQPSDWVHNYQTMLWEYEQLSRRQYVSHASDGRQATNCYHGNEHHYLGAYDQYNNGSQQTVSRHNDHASTSRYRHHTQSYERHDRYRHTNRNTRGGDCCHASDSHHGNYINKRRTNRSGGSGAASNRWHSYTKRSSCENSSDHEDREGGDVEHGQERLRARERYYRNADDHDEPGGSGGARTRGARRGFYSRGARRNWSMLRRRRYTHRRRHRAPGSSAWHASHHALDCCAVAVLCECVRAKFLLHVHVARALFCCYCVAPHLLDIIRHVLVWRSLAPLCTTLPTAARTQVHCVSTVWRPQ